MALKKQQYSDEEIAIFDEAVIYKRGAYWHFRMWLKGEGKYARKSLRTRSKTTAVEKGKAAYLEIYANLQHWLEFIGKDTKLKELERTDCEDYFHERMKRSNGNVKQVTVQNEQSTINAYMRWLYRNNETHFETFDFKKLPKIDRNNEAIRRATFTNDEYERIYRAMRMYCAKSTRH